MRTYLEEQRVRNDLSMMLHSERLGNSPQSEVTLLQILWMNGLMHYYELLHGPHYVSFSQRFLWQLRGIDLESKDEVFATLLRDRPDILERLDGHFFPKGKKQVCHRFTPCFDMKNARQENEFNVNGPGNKVGGLKLALGSHHEEDDNNDLHNKTNHLHEACLPVASHEIKPKPKKRKRRRYH